MSANPLPKVSLILPIYNKERFFDRCMDSIFAQTYNNLEIILVKMVQRIGLMNFVRNMPIQITESSMSATKTVV